MGFEVFLGVFTDGAPATIATADVLDVFAGHVGQSNGRRWRLVFDDSDCWLYAGDGDAIDSIMVERPVGDLRLWDGLFRVMGLGPVALYYPGGRAILVADMKVAEHLPPDMVESLGGVRVVRGGAEIVASIRLG